MITRNRLGLVSLCALGFAVACGGKDVLDLGGGTSADLGGGSPDGGPLLDGGNGGGSSSGGSSSGGSSSGGSSSGGSSSSGSSSGGSSSGGSSSGGSSSGGSSSGGSKSTSTAWLAFDSNRSGTRSVYFIEANGANLVRSTTTSANESEPAFSPDGTKLAFTSDASGVPQIYIRDLVAHTSKVLTSRPYGAHQPAWSPDGSLVAYVGLPEASQQDAAVNPPTGIADIYVIAPDGTGEKDVIGVDPALLNYAWYPAYYPATPTFTPDSKSIVFAEAESIYTVAADGSGLREIAGVETEGSETPSLSPDGTTVAFSSWSVNGEAILTTSYSGFSPDPAHDGLSPVLAAGTGTFRRPAWGAGANLIAFEAVSGNASVAGIDVVPTTGGAPMTVTSGASDDRNPAWAPAGFPSPVDTGASAHCPATCTPVAPHNITPCTTTYECDCLVSGGTPGPIPSSCQADTYVGMSTDAGEYSIYCCN